MRKRAAAVGLASLTLSIVPMAAHAAPAESGSAVCTWGGTPAAPTGHVTVTPGLTNTPSTAPSKGYATGPLAGGGPCTGTMTFRGFFGSGSSCASSTFDGQVLGVPGIATVHGVVEVGFVQEFLYGHRGNVVGSDQASLWTVANVTNPSDPAFTNCNKPQGTTGGNFSATVELYPSSGQGG